MVNGIEVYAILNIEDKNVMDMLRPFSIMMQDYKTIISHSVWNDHVKKQVSGVKVSLTEVATNVWAPCFQEMQQVVEKFHARSVTLQEIDYYLRDISPQNLRQEVLSLVEGCNKCLNTIASNSWISQFVMSVNRYRVICQAQCAAELVLKAKDALMLTGNFNKLENLREKVPLFIYYAMTFTMYCRYQSIWYCLWRSLRMRDIVRLKVWRVLQVAMTRWSFLKYYQIVNLLLSGCNEKQLVMLQGSIHSY